MQKKYVIMSSIACTTAIVVGGALIWKSRKIKASKKKRKKKKEEAVSTDKPRRKRKVNAEKLHGSEVDMFKASVSDEEAKEFQTHYDELEKSFMAHSMDDKKAVEVNRIGNLITFMLQTRRLIETDARNADMLLETADQFPDEVLKVADHIPEMGRRLILAQAKSLAASITKGVSPSKAAGTI